MIHKKENIGFFTFSSFFVLFVFFMCFVFLKNIDAENIPIETPKKSTTSMTIVTVNLEKKTKKISPVQKKSIKKKVKKAEPKIISKKTSEVKKQKVELPQLDNEKEILEEQKQKEELLALENEKNLLEEQKKKEKLLEEIAVAEALKLKREEEARVTANEKMIYLKELSLWIQSNLTYPRSARKLNQEGEVKVKFMISKSGDIHSVKVSCGCEYVSLNKAAKRLLEEYSHFKPLPKSLSELKLELPITYAMNN